VKNNIVYLFLFLNASALFAQQIQPAVQQGHFNDIASISLKNNEKTLQSIGLDGQTIEWDIKTGMQLNRVFNKSEQIVASMKNDYIKNNQIQAPNSKDSIKNIEKNVDGITYAIEGAHLTITRNGIKLASKTTEYFDLGYVDILIQSNNPYIFASSFDGKIYVYDKVSYKNVAILKNHQASVNSIVMTSDGKHMYSGSSDRSIIEWDAYKLQLKRRFHGHSFRITAVSFSEDENSLYFGNEIGEVKEFDLENHSQNIENNKISKHSIFAIQNLKIKESDQLIISGLDNVFYQLNAQTNKVSAYRRYHILSWKQSSKKIMESGIGLYMNPTFNSTYIHFNSQKTASVRAANEKWNRKRKKLIYENIERSSKKIIRSDYSHFKNICLINDSVFAVHREISDPMSANKDAALSIWKVIKNKSYYYGTKYINVLDIESFDNSKLLILQASALTVWDIITNKEVVMDLSPLHIYPKEIWVIDDFCFVSDYIGTVFTFKLSKSEKETQLNYKGKFSGHDGLISSIDINLKRNLIVTGSDDATLKFWSLDSLKELGALIPVSRKDFILLSPTGEYQITKNAFTKFGFSSGYNFIYPDQFDLQYNQPHVVARSIGIGTKESNDVLEKLYYKRLKRMGFENKSFKEQTTLPEIQLVDFKKIPNGKVALQLSASDSQFNLDRINVYINDVPIFGSNGYTLAQLHTKNWSETLTVDLLYGKNKIEISVLNANGVESIRQSLNIVEDEKQSQDLYLITLGASKYEDKRFNLTYPNKDAENIAELFSKKANGNFQNVFTLTLTNEELNNDALEECRAFLSKVKANDVTILFYAGHGVLDKDYNYYLASYDIDFLEPQNKGIAYEDLESLLDGIPSLRKVLFIDACHSGEVDKDEVEQLANFTESNGDIVFRNSGAGVQEKKVGLKSMNELMAEMYTDLRKGTGASVISSSGGYEFSMESEQWKNGLFTYCLLHGLKDMDADLNKDGSIMLSELQKYLYVEVSKLSNNAQRPTSRIENKSIDFRIW
jgi:WD40 repeat protein